MQVNGEDTEHAKESSESPFDAQAWRPIETAPRDGTAILAFWTPADGEPIERCYAITRYKLGDWLNIDDEDDTYCEPVAWMPLPSPPDAFTERETETQTSSEKGSVQH